MNFFYQLNFKYRVLILIASFLIGLTASRIHIDFIYLPMVVALFFYLPYIRELNNLQGTFIQKYFRKWIISVSFYFLIALPVIIQSALDNKPDTDAISILKLHLFFIFLITIGSLLFSLIWEKILKFDRIYCRIFINQLSLPTFSLIACLCFAAIGNATQGFYWYYSLIPLVLLLPWLVHMYGLTITARNENMPLVPFVYYYEKMRFEDHKKFTQLQNVSTRLIFDFIILPFIGFTTFFAWKDNEHERMSWGIGLTAFLLVIRFLKRKK